MSTIKNNYFTLLAVTAALILFGSCNQTSNSVSDKRTLLVVFDGLRPDYITPGNMPNLYKLWNTGAVAANHQSVYPTLTRVNSAAIATGAYPGTNGVLGNSVYLPSIDSSKGLNTGDASELMRIQELTQGNLFSSPTLGELLAKHGKKLMVFSTGSTGQSYLLNHTAGQSGTIVNPDLVIPDDFRIILEGGLGPVPSSDKKNMDRHTYIADAYIRFGLLANDAPEVSILWFADPDATAHAYGVGAEETLNAIRFVDNELGRVLKSIHEAGLDDKINILVATDHGFVTHIGTNDLQSLLIEKGFKKDDLSTDLVVAGGAIYIKDKTKIPEIVSCLQSELWIGAIFVRADSSNSIDLPNGTLSIDLVNMGHPERCPDILADMAWNDSTNVFGYAGMSYSRGIAGHGSSSPYETGIFLVAAGTDFQKGFKSESPSGNIDITPTILHLNDIEIPSEMNGRVLFELMAGKSNQLTETRLTNIIKTEDNGYKLELYIHKTGIHNYPAYSKVTRF